MIQNGEEESIEQKIGRNLANLRAMRRESTSSLAEASGITEKRIVLAERGLLRLTPEELIALCDALDVMLSQLMAGIE